MARKKTEEAEVVVTLNGEAAKNELKKLESEIDKYKQAAIDAYKAGNLAMGDEMSKKVTQLSKQYSICRKETTNYKQVLENLNTASIKQLETAQRQLLALIKKLTPGTKEFVEATRQYQQVKTRVNDLNKSYRELGVTTKTTGVSLKEIVDNVNKYFGLIMILNTAITGLSMTFRKCAEAVAELDDRYSDVMKTTGLTRDEVVALDKELTKIDTRSSRDQLLMLARDAGKLGISGSKNILGFVEAADKINVALGEDLGEGAIREIGKISDVFGATEMFGIADAMTKIGSAINAVGQASTASEAYLVGFTQRLSGAMAQAKISVADTIGFASAFDQSGMKLEMASTALQQFITKMFEDTATFAKYAGMELQEFSQLLNTDANEAIIKVLTSLNQAGGFKEIIPMFKDMGSEGVRAISALSAIATNIDAVTEAQSLANAEYEKGTSLSNEFAVKNNNLQANLDKARKEFKNATIQLGEKLNPVLLKTTNLTTYLIRALANYGKEIGILLGVIAALTLAIKVKTIAIAAATAAKKTARSASLLLAAAENLLTGNVMRAAAAWRLLSTAMKASVIGLVSAAVTGLIVLISNLVNKKKELAEVENYEQELNKKVVDGYKDEEARVNVLTKLLHNNNISLKERRHCLEELKKIVPGYHAELTEEGKLINDNTDALTRYIDTLKARTRMEVFQNEFKELETMLIEIEQKIKNAEDAAHNALVKQGNDETTKFGEIWDPSSYSYVQVYNGLTEYGKALSVVNKLESQRTDILQKQEILIASIGELTSKDDDKKDGTSASGGRSEEISDYETEIKELERLLLEKENFLKQSYIDEKITQEDMEANLIAEKLKFLEEKVKLAKKYGENESKVISEYLDYIISINKKSDAELLKLQQEEEKKAQKEMNETKKDEAKRQAEELNAKRKYLEELQMTAEKIRNEMASPIELYEKDKAELDEVYEAKLLSEEEYQQALLDLKRKYSKGSQSQIERSDMGLFSKYEAEKEALAQFFLSGKASWEEYEKNIRDLRIKYARETINNLGQLASQMSTFVTSLQDYELANAEANYNAQVAAAGDNAAARNAIDAKYEEDKLTIRKKYADADMAIQLLQIAASTAVAIMKAFAELGPYGGAIAAVLLGATAAAQSAVIIAQRNALKNLTAGGTTGLGSSGDTGDGGSGGNITITDRPMKSGGYAATSPSDNTPMGVYHANEYIAPAWMVRRNPVLFADIEQYRRTGTMPSRLESRESGGYANPLSPTPTQSAAGQPTVNSEDIRRLSTVLDRLDSKGVQAYMVYSQFDDFNKQRNRFKKIVGK